MKIKGVVFGAAAVLMVVLCGCSNSRSGPPAAELTDADGPPTGEVTETTADSEGEIQPTIESTATVSQPPTPEPTVEPTATLNFREELADVTSDFDKYSSDAFEIQLAYPDSWYLTEEPELGIFVESEDDYFATMPEAEGAGMIIYPRDELAGDDIVESLRQAIFNLGPPPSIFIEYPVVSTWDDHMVVTADFSVQESGIEGFYAFIQKDGRGVFVFAATTGLTKFYFRNLMDAVFSTVVLAEGSGTS